MGAHGDGLWRGTGGAGRSTGAGGAGWTWAGGGGGPGMGTAGCGEGMGVAGGGVGMGAASSGSSSSILLTFHEDESVICSRKLLLQRLGVELITAHCDCDHQCIRTYIHLLLITKVIHDSLLRLPGRQTDLAGTPMPGMHAYCAPPPPQLWLTPFTPSHLRFPLHPLAPPP